MAAAFGECEPPASRREWRSVFQEFGQGGNGAGSNQRGGFAKWPSARLLGADCVDRDVWQSQVRSNCLEQPGPLLQRLD